MRCASVRLTIFLIVRACAPQVFTSLGVDVTGGGGDPTLVGCKCHVPAVEFFNFRDSWVVCRGFRCGLWMFS